MGAAMTLHAVLEILDAFLEVLTRYIFQGVLVAAVTGVFLVVAVGVAGDTRDVVIAIQYEQLGVVEGGGLPAVLGMTLTATRPGIDVNCSLWGGMAAFATVA